MITIHFGVLDSVKLTHFNAFLIDKSAI